MSGAWLQWATSSSVAQNRTSPAMQNLLKIGSEKLKGTVYTTSDKVACSADCNSEFGIYDGKTPNQQFEKSLVDLLSQTGPLTYNSGAVLGLINSRPQAVKSVVQKWPLGYFRSRTCVVLVGPYLCLPESQFDAMDKCRTEHLDMLERDTWEPLPPAAINDSADFELYVKQFVQHFGPTWVMDVHYQYLQCSLPEKWKGDGGLLQSITKIQDIIIIYGTIYDFGLPQHRQAIVFHELLSGGPK